MRRADKKVSAAIWGAKVYNPLRCKKKTIGNASRFAGNRIFYKRKSRLQIRADL